MADWWPTDLEGDRVACGALAARLRHLATEVDQAAKAVTHDVRAPVWSGGARDRAALRVSAEAASADRIARRMRSLAVDVAELGEALGRAAAVLAGAHARAVAHGLPTTAGGFTAAPDHPAAQAVRAARDDEFRAHQALAAALRTVTEGGVAERLVTSVVDGVLHLPDPDNDLLGQASWIVGLPGAGDLLTDQAKTRLATFRAHRVARALGSENPHVAGAAAAVTRAGPVVARVAKASGPAGAVLTVVTEGRSQWQADADDPRLSTADRVGRTATRATLGAAVAIEGAIIGAAVGSAIPVVGTAAGAVVGAAVGSFVVSELGRSSVDAAVEGADDVIDLAGAAASAVGDAASHAAAAVDDAAGAIGDTVGTAADKICFWN